MVAAGEPERPMNKRRCAPLPAPVIDMAPETLPIMARAWCVRDKPTPKRPAGPAARRPRHFLAPRVVETGGNPELTKGPAATLGVARLGRIRGRRWHSTVEIWFHGPGAAPADIGELRRFVDANAMPRGSGEKADLVWRDEMGVRISIEPLENFRRTLIRAMTRPTLIVGHDMLATFGALAIGCGRARRRSKKSRSKKSEDQPEPPEREPDRPEDPGAAQFRAQFRREAWSLTLSDYADPVSGIRRPDPFAPRVRVKLYGEGAACTLAAAMKGAAQPEAECLDLANLCHALTGERRGFEDDVALFCGTQGEPGAGVGVRMREAGRGLTDLATAAVDWFDALHQGLSRGEPAPAKAGGGWLSEARVFSPGGIGRALAAPYAPAPAVEREMIGLCAEANHGAWCGIDVRGRVPVVETDYRRQYATIFVRQRIGDLLAGRRLAFIEATEEIRRLAESGPVILGPHLNAVCLVHWRGEPAMVRALFANTEGREIEAADFTLARVARHTDAPVPAFLADVVAARVLGGQTPEIVKAWRIEAADPRPIGAIDVLARRIDPATVPVPLALAEEGRRLELGQGRWRRAKVSAELRSALVKGIKAAGNIFAYGMLLQTNEIDLSTGATEEVMCLRFGSAMRRKVAVPEEDTALTCVPLAGLVAASGRLLLARLHRAVADRGGTVACWDTDSAHIVATREGGMIGIERHGAAPGAGMPHGRIRALSWREVDEIAALFESENPFDKGLFDGSALRVTAENFDPETRRQRQLEGVYVATKRYGLRAPGEGFIDMKGSVIGVPMPPVEGFEDAAGQWIAEALGGREPPAPVWFEAPVVCALDIATPGLLFAVTGRDPSGRRVREAALPGAYPGMRYLAATVIGAPSGPAARYGSEIATDDERHAVVAPFSADPATWETLGWRSFKTGEALALGDDRHLRRWGALMSDYIRGGVPSMLGPDGKPAGAFTLGVLRSRAMRDGRRFYTLKEGPSFGTEPDTAMSLIFPEWFEGDPAPEAAAGPSLEWEPVRATLKIPGLAAVATRLGLADSTVEAWSAGEREPEMPVIEVRRAVREATADILGRFYATTSLDDTLVAAHRFNRMVAALIGPDNEALAKRLFIAKRTFETAIGTKAPGRAKPIGGFLGRLGALARVEVRKTIDERDPKRGLFRKGKPLPFETGRSGDRQACVALLSMVCGAKEPALLTPEECLGIPPRVAALIEPEAPERWLADMDKGPAWRWLRWAGTVGRVLEVSRRKGAA
jgi:hypothetical protein